VGRKGRRQLRDSNNCLQVLFSPNHILARVRSYKNTLFKKKQTDKEESGWTGGIERNLTKGDERLHDDIRFKGTRKGRRGKEKEEEWSQRTAGERETREEKECLMSANGDGDGLRYIERDT